MEMLVRRMAGLWDD